MDMSNYASKRFLKPEDVANAPMCRAITAVEEGQYGKPVLTFEDGTRLSLNGTNVDTLLAAFGCNSNDYIGETIELYAGTLRYNGNDNPAVLVRALNPASPAEIAKTRPAAAPLDDEVPF